MREIKLPVGDVDIKAVPSKVRAWAHVCIPPYATPATPAAAAAAAAVTGAGEYPADHEGDPSDGWYADSGGVRARGEV